jgi:hypothetical protein
MLQFEGDRKLKESIVGQQESDNNGLVPIEMTDLNTVFRPGKNSSDTVISNPLTLKTKSSMNYVFLPVKERNEVIQDLSFLHSAVPKVKLFLNYIRTKQIDLLNLPFFISFME